MTTPLQMKMLKAIAEDLLTPLNGRAPEDAENATTFTDQVINSEEDKGTFTSCLNAGLVWKAGKGSDSCCGLTDEGFAEYVAWRASC